MLRKFCVYLVAGACCSLATVWPTAPTQGGHANLTPLLDANYVRAQYDKGRKLTPIDLRSADDFRRGHLPGARSLPIDELASRFEEIPRVDLVVLYCECAPREIEAASQFLRGHGYRNLSVLEQGFSVWLQRGYPIER